MPTSARSASTSSSSIWPTGTLTVTAQVASMPLWEVTVMSAVPSLTPVMTPTSSTVTTSSLLDTQVKSVGAW